MKVQTYILECKSSTDVAKELLLRVIFKDVHVDGAYVGRWSTRRVNERTWHAVTVYDGDDGIAAMGLVRHGGQTRLLQSAN